MAQRHSPITVYGKAHIGIGSPPSKPPRWWKRLWQTLWPLLVRFGRWATGAFSLVPITLEEAETQSAHRLAKVHTRHVATTRILSGILPAAVMMAIGIRIATWLTPMKAGALESFRYIVVGVVIGMAAFLLIVYAVAWVRALVKQRDKLRERQPQTGSTNHSADQQQRKTEMKIAVQAIREGLLQAQLRLQDCIDTGNRPEYAFNRNQWIEHQDTLALSSEIYDPVLKAMVALDHANNQYHLGAATEPPFPVATAKQLMKLVLLAQQAVEVRLELGQLG